MDKIAGSLPKLAAPSDPAVPTQGWSDVAADRVDLLAAQDRPDAPNPVAAGGAKQAVALLRKMDFRPGRIVASAEGGVAITFRRQDRYADVEFLNSGEVVAVVSDGGGDPEVWTVGPDTLASALERIRDFIQRLPS